MSAASNAQAVTGLLTDPTCPHCRKPIASGSLLASHAQDLWAAIVAALAASDLPADVPRRDGLDLTAELGAARWALDLIDFRFVPGVSTRDGVGWRVFRLVTTGRDEPAWVPMADGSWVEGLSSHAVAALEVVRHVVDLRLSRRFFGRSEDDSPLSPIIAGSGTYAP